MWLLSLSNRMGTAPKQMAQHEQRARVKENRPKPAEPSFDLPFAAASDAPLGISADMQVAMLKRLPPRQQQRMLQRVGRAQGNQHVANLVTQFRQPVVQTKLTLNEPDDAYEQEADAVADQVVQMRLGDEPPIQRASSENGGVPVTPQIENRVGQLQGGGQPLPDNTRTFFEDRMGADFSDVRIHADSPSADLSRDLQARAFTVGNDIAFNRGEYNPDSDEGKHLLAHELTHTLQQGASLQRRIQREIDPNATPTEEPTETGARAPQSADQDPAFQAVISQTQAAATQEKTHEPTEQTVLEAQNAAEMPLEEKEGTAQDTHIDKLDAAAQQQQAATAGGNVPGFDKEAFKAAIRAKINSLLPNSEEEFESFGSNNRLDEVRTAVDSQLETAEETAQGEVDDRVEEPPDMSVVPEKPVTPLVATDPGMAPANIDGSQAAPKERTAAEFEEPVAEESRSLDAQMTEAEITEEQLAISNEPDFLATLDAKNEAQDHAAAAPAAYRVREGEVIGSAEANAQTTVSDQVNVIHDDRVALLGNVDGLQVDTQSADEAKRQEIGQAINGIFETTKQKVTTTLNQLDTTVDTIFTNGANAAKATFTDNAERRAAAYKAERYNQDADWYRVDQHVSGAVTRVGDAVFGLPDEYLQIYNEERDRYVAAMEIVLTDVANAVAEALTTARQQIAEGRQQINDYVANQPAELQSIAQTCANDVQGQFDALEQQVDDKRQALIDDLAQRYSEDLATVNAIVEEARSETTGLIDQAAEWIDRTIGVIFEMKEMLLSVAEGAMGAVMTILEDPITFVQNLFDGVLTGLGNFSQNILTHLETGFFDWLTGTVGSLGIDSPDDIFSLEGIADIAFQMLGLTYDAIRSRAVGILGEPIVNALETGFELVMILRDEGLIGVWEWIQEHLSSLKDTIVEGIQEMLASEVIEAGIQWLIGLLGGPAGAFVKACVAIYDLVMWFKNNASRLMSLIEAVVAGVQALASGDVGALARSVEDALARFIPTAIGFLASLLGIGDISEKVRRTIDRVREPIEQAVDYVLELVRGFVQKVARWLGLGESGQDDQIGEEVTFSDGQESHRLWVEAQSTQATVMVASTPMTVEDRLTDWENRVGTELSPEDQETARGLIGQARSELTTTDNSADTLARMRAATMTMDDADTVEAEGAQLHAQESTLATTLGSLFELFDQPYEMPLVTIQFNCDISRYDANEYERQLKGQENGINSLLVSDWVSNRVNYIMLREETGSGRSSEGSREQQAFRENARQILTDRILAQRLTALSEDGIDEEDIDMEALQNEVAQEVDEHMAGQAALHDPDQIAGGNPTHLRDLGDSRINSSIGSQWRHRVSQLDEAFDMVPADKREETYMNVRLTL